jgi:hypothetical protein
MDIPAGGADELIAPLQDSYLHHLDYATLWAFHTGLPRQAPPYASSRRGGQGHIIRRSSNQIGSERYRPGRPSRSHGTEIGTACRGLCRPEGVGGKHWYRNPNTHG